MMKKQETIKEMKSNIKLIALSLLKLSKAIKTDFI